MNATQTNYTVGYNGIGGVTLTTNGAGCTSPPTVTFGAPATAGGTTAIGVATVSGGIVTGVVMTNFGSGYTGTVAPTVTFTNPAGGGCTTLPVATSTLAPGTVGTVTFTNAANGTNLYCLNAPYVYILGGGGTGASAAVMLKGTTVLESIGITEGFDIEYGRMYVIMGTAPTPLLPTAPSAVALANPGLPRPANRRLESRSAQGVARDAPWGGQPRRPLPPGQLPDRQPGRLYQHHTCRPT